MSLFKRVAALFNYNKSNEHIESEIPFQDETTNLNEENLSDSNENNSTILNDESNTLSMSEQFDVISTNMVGIINKQREIQNSIEGLKATTIQLGQTIRMSSMHDGLCKLCDLWRITKRSSDDKDEIYAEKLYEILISLGANPIKPQPGENYNPTLHIHENCNSIGSIITSCEGYNCGWKYNDIVLKKAVVITKRVEEKSDE